MKRKVLSPIEAALSSLCIAVVPALGQGTAFTYQGRLTDNGGPANGNYDLQFYLRDAASGGNPAGMTNTLAPVLASNGLFTVTLDFGAGIFTGNPLWLEIGVRTNGSLGPYTTLTPRQLLTPSPYAIMANSASNLLGSLPAAQLSGTLLSSQLGGTYAGPVTLSSGANSFSGSFNGNGGGLTNVNAATLGGFGSSNFWNTSGNGGTTPGVNFLGTTDNQPLELRVNGVRVLRLEPATNGAPNVIGGASINFAAPGTMAVTIAGGGATNVNYTNIVAANFASILGGGGNTIQTNANDATISGGDLNTIQAGSYESVIGGGGTHTIQGSSANSVIAGGYLNVIQSNSLAAAVGGGHMHVIQGHATGATIAGGEGNTIQANAADGTIAGGSGNNVSGRYGTVPGGDQNLAGTNSLAAGHRAKAGNTGSFVWADSTDVDFSSTSANQFLIRANGGVGIGTNNPQSALHVAGSITAGGFSGGGSGLTGVVWTNVTGVNAGPGLSLGPSNTLSVNFAGDGAATTAARSDHDHLGQVWTGTNATGLGLVTTAASGAVALSGRASDTGGGGGRGVYGESDSTAGYGVYALANSTTGTNYGIWAQSASSSGFGVYGVAQATAGTNYGVYGKTLSPAGFAGYFENLASTLVPANSNIALRAFAAGGSVKDLHPPGTGFFGAAGEFAGFVGVYGAAVTNTLNGIGVWGTAPGVQGIGVYGNATSTNSNATGTGVLGTSYAPVGVGVSGQVGNTGFANFGVSGSSSSIFGIGVYAAASATTGTNYGLLASTASASGSAVAAQGTTNGVALQIVQGGVRVKGAGINTGTAAFIQLTAAGNIVSGRSVIDNPFCNGDPNAILLVTHNANPTNGMIQTLYNHAVGVTYANSKWNIYNEDGTSIAANLAFNVLVIKN